MFIFHELRGSGEGDGDGGAVGGRGGDGEVAAVKAGYLPAEGEPDSAATAFGGYEGLK